MLVQDIHAAKTRKSLDSNKYEVGSRIQLSLFPRKARIYGIVYARKQKKGVSRAAELFATPPGEGGVGSSARLLLLRLLLLLLPNVSP